MANATPSPVRETKRGRAFPNLKMKVKHKMCLNILAAEKVPT